MLTYGEVKELSVIRADEDHFVSLYLNVNPQTNPRGDYLIHFKTMVKQTMEGLDKKTARGVKEDIEKIELFIKDNKREFKKGVSIISSVSRGIWKDFHISLPVKNELIVDSTPYIKPLLALLDNYQRCAVLLVDRETARVFVINLGEIQEYTEVSTPDIPGRHKKGGWFSLQQKRFERHIEHHVNMHIRDVINVLDDFFHREAISSLIMGGPEEAIVKTRNMLSKTIRGKLAATFHADIMMPEKDVLDTALKITGEAERKKEADIVAGLITRAMKKDMAVIGLEVVLDDLQAGKVMRLVFLKELTTGGYKCANCGFLTIRSGRSCSYCGGQMEEVRFLIDYAVQKAVEQGVGIEVINESDELARAGGIGAFLRY